MNKQRNLFNDAGASANGRDGEAVSCENVEQLLGVRAPTDGPDEAFVDRVQRAMHAESAQRTVAAESRRRQISPPRSLAVAGVGILAGVAIALFWIGWFHRADETRRAAQFDAAEADGAVAQPDSSDRLIDAVDGANAALKSQADSVSAVANASAADGTVGSDRLRHLFATAVSSARGLLHVGSVNVNPDPAGRDLATVGDGGAVHVTYADFSLGRESEPELDPADVGRLPTGIARLAGRRVRIRGFMFPTFEETGIEAFALVRDNEICCFGGSPRIDDVMTVALRNGLTTDYIQNRPVDVEGIFGIDPEVEDGRVVGLYRLVDAVVVERD